jgi:hypothetical protein
MTCYGCQLVSCLVSFQLEGVCVTRSETLPMRRNGAGNWAVELRDDERDDIRWNFVGWDTRPKVPVLVHGVWAGRYRVTRDDIPDWCAILTVDATPPGVSLWRGDFTTGKVETRKQRVHLALVVRRVEIVRNHSRAHLRDTALPIDQLLQACARVGAASGYYMPPGKTHNGKVVDKKRWSILWTGDDTPDDDTVRRVTGADKRSKQYATKEELYAAVLGALAEHKSSNTYETQKAYVARATGRNKNNIGRDIANARNWQKQRQKGKKK